MEPQTSTAVVVYQFTPEELRRQLAPYSGCSFETPAAYKEGTKAIAVCRSLRGEIEARRVELKADALSYGRRVDAVAKELTAVVEEIEDPIKVRKRAVDEEKERIKREAKEAEEAELRAKVEAAAAERRAAEEALRVQREAEAAAERERLAAERAELEAARAKLEAERAAAEAEMRAREEAARAKLEADCRRAEEERAQLDAERQRIRMEQSAEQARLDAEREAIEEAKREAEATRKATEQAALDPIEQVDINIQEAEDPETHEEPLATSGTAVAVYRFAPDEPAEERAIREAERKAAIEARREAIRPDSEKASRYVEALLAVEVPALVDDDLREILEDLRSGIYMAFSCMSPG